ncbi:hypothetical protein [Pseudomonas fluorescens]|uniref:hypothetical protein n=1 Tax=Pseudomonas fluorescens TaxID=294 RepID=UPI003CFE2A76
MTNTKDLSSHYFPGTNLLPKAVVVDADKATILYTNAVPESGAIVRIETYTGIVKGDLVTLFFKGNTEHTDTFVVHDTSTAIDIVLPKSLIRENITEENITHCTVAYRVSSTSEPEKNSAITTFAIVPEQTPLRQPLTPSINGEEIDPPKIPEPGLPVVFYLPGRILHARWTSFAKSGRLLYEEEFGVQNESHVIVRAILNLTEPGGEIRISYFGSNSDNILTRSPPAVLRVINKNPAK